MMVSAVYQCPLLFGEFALTYQKKIGSQDHSNSYAINEIEMRSQRNKQQAFRLRPRTFVHNVYLTSNNGYEGRIETRQVKEFKKLQS